MTETKISISELKDEGSDVIKELVTYLKDKTSTEVETAGNEIIIKGEEPKVSRTYLRVLLKKFIHKKELKEHFRVIGGEDNTLIVKGKKTFEEE
ncbi:MAG TPA: 60S ribosomal protein L22 [Candidatus Bathyarchaeia archaeon]|nr:60S ribosomal protein L22 [Candidatus Bathyarchaeia archaeon]